VYLTGIFHGRCFDFSLDPSYEMKLKRDGKTEKLKIENPVHLFGFFIGFYLINKMANTMEGVKSF